MNFQVIRAKKDNAIDMGFVHSHSWQKAYRGIIPDEIVDSFTPEKKSRNLLTLFLHVPEEYYLFRVDGHPAGIASLNKSHEENAPDYIGEIYSIYFHPDFWGTSATHKGLQFCVERLKSLGYTQVTIWVLKDNLRARSFYEKNDFFFDGLEQEINIGKPFVEIRYSKKI
jgi:RimJ/RimL family protein N-acetyltransferase